ncbi:hypothetical protein N7519_011175 [Penicillium mononematosum]|uniref:uncharacterized protein n=1 Tax=Penicillium mononematosum TaxID=268346 RepID=UPI0025499ED0|nr:uncharacterized protein N7519_011175 [Penicillium mononematosum]KAJ6180714.1 hypothetical protein N7519_011175 [Penicillium mononematosum]
MSCRPSPNGTIRICEDDYAKALVNIRTVINVFNYLNEATRVQPALTTVSNDIRAELKRADDAWVADGNPSTQISQYWSKWIRGHYRYLSFRPYPIYHPCHIKFRGSLVTQ